MKATTSVTAAILLAAAGLAAATSVATATPPIRIGGLSPRGMALNNISRAQRSNNAVLNRVQNNIRASQRARYRAQRGAAALRVEPPAAGPIGARNFPLTRRVAPHRTGMRARWRGRAGGRARSRWSGQRGACASASQ